ncbi:hypothetical protein M0638_25025 [Roseomonas sp. NAR14]|uniref:Uncharacterized protein n=1 Tax=Roseomonas acroporae TaxID=2937791 RepID=A0A9X2BZ37_9PROT|nr:hypothetical protein [Roseomonas acroporae]MCK8787634.1 hypothetical protein [Roseomonas acroporae]
MTRPLATAVSTAASAPVVHLAVLVELDFAPDPLRLWSGIGDFVWGNMTFTGAGTLMGVGEVEETTETRAAGTTLSLSGVPSELIDHAMVVDWQGRAGRIWLALLDDAGGLLGDPVQALGGRMDVMSWAEGETATISLTVESRLADLERARVRRYTDRDQQDEYPNDLGFAYVASLQNQEIRWGKNG